MKERKMTQTNKTISFLLSAILGIILGCSENSFAIGFIAFQACLSLSILMAIAKD